MAHYANAVVCSTSSPADDGAAAVAAIVTARRAAWERAQRRGVAAPRRCAELREAAVTNGPDMSVLVWDWAASKGSMHAKDARGLRKVVVL